MWKYYDNIPNHSNHWRYEVDGKFYITQVRHHIWLLHFFEKGNEVYTTDFPVSKYVKATKTIAPPMNDNEEARQWAEMMWLTDAWKTYEET